MAGLIKAGTYRVISQDGLTEKDITIDNSGNPLFDNNKLLQESNMGNLKTQDVISGNTNLSQSHFGKLLVCISAATITLPAINTIQSGSLLWLSNASGGTVTIALNGNSTDASSLLLYSGHSLLLQCDGYTYYRTILDAKKECNASGDAPIFACRSWVNFNGTGTIAIRASGNVSSITDNGTGDYIVNLSTGMPDTNYAVVSGQGLGTTGNPTSIEFVDCITTAFRIRAFQQPNIVYDEANVSVAVFR